MNPGDIVLVRSPGILARLIRIGERLRRRGKWCYWNHVGIITSTDGDTIEAWGRGMVRANLRDHADYKVVSSGLGEIDRLQAVSFAESTLGRWYGFLTILSIAVDLVTPDWVTFRSPNTFICSELVARCMEHGGWISPIVDTSQVMPSDIARWFDR